MKRIFAYLILFFIFITPTKADNSYCDGSTNYPCLVIDANQQVDSFQYYRDAQLLKSVYLGNTTGLESLKLSGSAMPTQKAWLQYPRTSPVLVIDLRQETHGYLNGQPFTLAELHDWINIDKSDGEVSFSESVLIGEIRTLSEVLNVLTPEQFTQHDFMSGMIIPVVSVESEETVVTNLGYQYLRLNITDHRAPNDAVVDKLIKVLDELPQGTWIHVHCRGGKGRTTTVMAMIDMLKNADKVSFLDILSRQAVLPPYYNLSQVNNKDPEMVIYYQKRYQFLQNFYQYALARLKGKTELNWQSWSDENYDKDA